MIKEPIKTSTLASPARLLVNSSWNLLGFSFSLASQLAIIPIVVNSIGLKAFGEASLVMAIASPMLVVGTVTGQAVITRLSARLSSDGDTKSDAIIVISLAYCLLASTIAALAIAIFAPLAASRLFGEIASSNDYVNAFLIFSISMVARQLITIFQSISSAKFEFRKLPRYMAASAIADLTAVLLCTSYAPTALGYLIGLTCGSVVTLALWSLSLRHLSFRHSTTLWATEWRALTDFAKWQGLSSLLAILAHHADKLMLGIVGSAVHVGSFNVANRLQEAGYICLIKGSEVLLPQFSRLDGMSEIERGRNFLTSSLVVNTLGTAAMTPMIPLAHEALLLWVGPSSAENTGFLLQILMIGSIVGLCGITFNYYALGTGEHRLSAQISIGHTLGSIVLTIVLFMILGPLAAGIGMIISGILRMIVQISICRYVLFPYSSLLDFIPPIALPQIVGLSFGIYLNLFDAITAGTWVSFATVYIATSTITCLLIVAASLMFTGSRRIVSERVMYAWHAMTKRGSQSA